MTWINSACCDWLIFSNSLGISEVIRASDSCSAPPAKKKREPGQFAVRLLILHFKVQISKCIKSSRAHIFLHLTYPLGKNISSPKSPKIFIKPSNIDWWDKQRDLALLETWPRYWQKDRVKRRQNSIDVYEPRRLHCLRDQLKMLGASFSPCMRTEPKPGNNNFFSGKSNLVCDRTSDNKTERLRSGSASCLLDEYDYYRPKWTSWNFIAN